MNYTTVGVIDTVFDEETVGQNGFKKRAVWIVTDEQYSQVLEIQFTQHNVDQLDGYEVGQKVQITFNIQGRKTNHATYGERVFNTNIGFQITRV